MQTVTINLPLTIQLDGPLHIGTGYERGLLNRTIVKTRQNQVYLPGSSLRGVLRDTSEQLARTLDLKPKPCSSPIATNMCGRKPKICLVCRTFGSPGQESGLIVDDAYLRADIQKALSTKVGRRTIPMGQTLHRTQVQLSRLRGLAHEARLFSSEFATEGLILETTISGTLELTPLDPDQQAEIKGEYYELILLLSAIKMVTHLGGGRRRGAGACRLSLPETIAIRRHGGETREVKVNQLLKQADVLELFSEWG